MAATAHRTPITFCLHVADLPDNVGIGATPESAAAALAADVRRIFADHADVDALVFSAVASAHPATVTVGTPDAARAIIEGLIGSVRAMPVLSALGVL